MKILYIDGFLGFSIEAFLGSLIDLGIDKQYLHTELEKLKIFDYELNLKDITVHGISGKTIKFDLLQKNENLCKNFSNIVYAETTIKNSDFSNITKEKISSVFKSLAEVEKKNSTDNNYKKYCEEELIKYTIFIAAVIICLEYYKPDKIISSSIQIGNGIKVVDGVALPLPEPSTLELLRKVPVRKSLLERETIDCIGAALLINIVHEFTDIIDFNIDTISYGMSVAKEEQIVPILRTYYASFAETKNDITQEEIKKSAIVSKNTNIKDNQYIIECNIDDMSSENYDFVMTKLLEAGALDAYFTPIIMKKGRPAIKISALCEYNKLDIINEVLFINTTTFGTRSYKVEKTMLERTFTKVKTIYGEMTVKSGYLRGKKIKSKPEYEECKKIALEKDEAISVIYNEVIKNI
jgi:uncharacterized protein (DUF111 family)